MREDRIRWNQIPYHKPGNKPLTWKEQKRKLRMEDKFEKKVLAISFGLQAYNPSFPPPIPIILQPKLHTKPCSLCYEFVIQPWSVLSCVPYALRLEIVTISWLVRIVKITQTTSLGRLT
jgi:hypothetical protein